MALAYLDRMVADGYGRAVTVGAFSTGIVGGGNGTVLDLDQPELVIAIPTNLVVRILRAEIVVQGGISTADSDETEALLGVDSLGYWTVDGTSTAENPSNLNSRLDKGSACKVGSAFTADMTTTPRNGGTAADPVIDIELARVVETADQGGTAANVAYRGIRLEYQPLIPPWLEGQCSIVGYWGGTIATVGGYAVVQWVEAPPDIMRKYMKGEL